MSNQYTYHEHVADTSYAKRRTEYRTLTLASPPESPYTELVRVIEGEPVATTLLLDAAAALDERTEDAGVLLHGILAILGRFPEPAEPSRDLLDADVRERLRDALLGFRYWLDEPGSDLLRGWTEAHQMMLASGAYLAAQLYPDEVFTNSGRTGREQMNRFRPRIERWLDLRFRAGLSEWYSPVAYSEHLVPLLNLIEFAYDPKLVRSATMVIDVMLLDLVLNQFRGIFGAAEADDEPVRPASGRGGVESLLRLVFGPGRYHPGHMSATLLAVSTRYEVPAVLAAIANDTERPELENRQRMGISLADVERWGLGFRSLEDGIVYLGMGAHFHERTAPLTLRVLDEYRLWNHPYFARLRSRRGLVEAARALGIVRPLARRYQRSVDARINEEVNLYTYRTPDYLLRCVQDQVAPGAEDRYVWQATLGPGAVVSTNPIEGARLAAPRAVAYRNIVICLYRDGAACRFPRQAFDEVREASGWVLARRADGYVAVRSGRPYTWQDSGGGSDQLIVSAGPVAWICICGRAYTHESFDRFVDSVTGARVEFGRGQADRVEIDIAPHGLVAFGRRGPLAVGGRQITVTAHLHDSPYPAAEGYRRFDNPYVSAEFPANIVRVRCADEQLSLNWRDQARSASSFL